MKKVGEHVTIDFLGVKRDYAPDFYNKVIHKIAKKAKIEVLNIAEKIFKPQGYTCLALLAESHMSFHTFPEKGIISFDFFTCGKISPTAALDILKEEIKHERAVVRSFDRSNKGIYEDIYSTPGHKKYYVVSDVLENFVSSPFDQYNKEYTNSTALVTARMHTAVQNGVQEKHSPPRNKSDTYFLFIFLKSY